MLHTMQFCVFLKAKGLSVQSIRVSWPSPVRQLAKLKRQMLEGWFRKTGISQDAREPAILRGTQAAWKSLCSGTIDFTLSHPGALVAFWRALRFSELVVGSLQHISDHALRIGDIILSSQEMRIMLCHSKTDQISKGVLIVLVPLQMLHCARCQLYFTIWDCEAIYLCIPNKISVLDSVKEGVCTVGTPGIPVWDQFL